ncbi:MAG: galactokinase family protein, partial [Pseudomonadota bacterium]
MSASVERAAARGFREHYGREPAWVSVAPGRVNLIGEHTDYTGGFAMPFAIGRAVAIAADRASASGLTRAATARDGSAASIDLAADPLPRTGDWSDYLRGVIQGHRDAGIDPGALDLYVHSDLPSGAGLSSSAALEVATALIVEAAAAVTHDPERTIRLCRQAEHDYAGVPCGHLDQFAVVMARHGACLLFDARALQATPVPFALPETELLLLDSGVRHALGDSEYPRRRAECEAAEQALGCSLRDATAAAVDRLLARDSLLGRRARHIVSENTRVLAMRDALERADSKAAGALLYAGHASLAQDFEISAAEIDWLVQRCRDDAHGGDVYGIDVSLAPVPWGDKGEQTLAISTVSSDGSVALWTFQLPST